VSAVPAGPHGGDGRIVAAALGIDPASVLDLSASLNPFAPPLGRIVEHHLEATIGRYPDAIDVARATASMADVLGVDHERVLLTNGGAEAIALVGAELGRGSVEGPEFSLYARHLAVIERSAPRFRSDPNNPTGALAALDERAGVWDEAFYPLATGRWTRLSAPGARAHDAAVVVGSLTKVLACPGLRLGYVIGPADGGEGLGFPDLVGRLARRQPRWSVATPALAALPDLLAVVDLETWSGSVAEARTALVAVLERHDWAVRPSAANFVLVDGAPRLRDALAAHGIVVRDCASFGLPDCVRVAVPDRDGLARLESALARVSDHSHTTRAGRP
jgi:histidinol-phosphate/aromatic aminotransferase/cobyric acid decarboxylase-like protein